jgi:hypothetical protein
MSVALVGVVETVPVVVANAVNVPAAAVEAPIVVPLIVLLVTATPEAVPPVIATAEAFCAFFKYLPDPWSTSLYDYTIKNIFIHLDD